MTADPRYPVGKFQRPGELTVAERNQMIDQIATAPAKLRKAVEGLSPSQLDTPYREGGWTARQVVHHIPDSHLNAYIRFKLALTEDNPTIKPYDEARWAELRDSFDTPTEVSMALLDSLHLRWGTLLRSLGAADFGRRLNHPEMGPMTLDHVLALYAWHGRHHVGHIASLREQKRW
jgi:uncharacterized damage-inducible protein DinB